MKQVKDLNVGVWFGTLAGNCYKILERADGEGDWYKVLGRTGGTRLLRGEVRTRSEIPGTGEPVLIGHLEMGAWFSHRGCIYKITGTLQHEKTGAVVFLIKTASGPERRLPPETKVEVVKAQSHEFPCNCGAIFTKYDAYLAHAATFNCKSGSPDGVLSEGVKHDSGDEEHECTCGYVARSAQHLVRHLGVCDGYVKVPKGIKHDGEKPMMGLLPFGPLREVAKVLTFGAKKYAPNNWKKVTPPSRYFDAALRHLADYAEGEDDDQESGLSHLAHAACCLLFALWHQGKGRPARHSEED